MRDTLIFAIQHLADTKDPTFNPDLTVTKLRALAIGFLGIALITVSVVGIFTAGRRGHASKGAAIVGTTVMLLIPAALGAGALALAFGAAFLGWAVPGLS